MGSSLIKNPGKSLLQVSSPYSTIFLPKITKIINSRVLDPRHFNADSDPDPAFNFYTDPDPDPALQFNADPDQAFHSNAEDLAVTGFVIWGSGLFTACILTIQIFHRLSV